MSMRWCIYPTLMDCRHWRLYRRGIWTFSCSPLSCCSWRGFVHCTAVPWQLWVSSVLATIANDYAVSLGGALNVCCWWSDDGQPPIWSLYGQDLKGSIFVGWILILPQVICLLVHEFIEIKNHIFSLILEPHKYVACISTYLSRVVRCEQIAQSGDKLCLLGS